MGASLERWDCNRDAIQWFWDCDVWFPYFKILAYYNNETVYVGL